MKHEKNQGTKSVPKADTKINPTVERLTAEQLRQLTPQERIEYAKKLNGSQPKTTANCLVLDKSTTDKISKENESKAVNQATLKAEQKSGKKAKSGKKSGKKTEVKTVSSFQTAVTEFEKIMIEVLNGTIDEKRYGTATTTIAKAITYNLIKKLIEVAQKTPKDGTSYSNISYDKTMENIRIGLIMDFVRLDKVNYSDYNGTFAVLDKNGNIKCKVSDSALNKAIDDNIKDSLSDGMDILDEVVTALLEEVRKAENFSVGYFFSTVTDRKLKSGKVYAKNGKKEIEWISYEITPIQRVYRKARAYIQSNKALKTIINGFSYIEGVSLDEDSGKAEQIFYRLNKYSTLCEKIVDFNGKEYAVITSAELVDEWDKVLADFISKTNIDQKYIDLIEMRKDKNTLVDIGYKMGVTSKTVERMLTQLKKIAVDNGYGNESMLTKVSNDEKAKAIECWIYTDFNAYKDYCIPIQHLESQKVNSELLTVEDKKKNKELDEQIKPLKAEMRKYKPISIAESVRKAESLTGVSKSTIDRILKGETRSSKGYYFRYVDTPIIIGLNDSASESTENN